MTLLLTGASGFLGRNIIGRLSESYRVTTLARSAGNDIAVFTAMCMCWSGTSGLL